MELATVEYRPGRIEELADFGDFWLAMFEEIGILHERDMAPDWRARFARYLELRIAGGEAQFFVAHDGERVVATAGALIADGYPFVVHAIKRGYIFGVRVAPEFRKRGIAERLTAQCVEFLHGAGCVRVRLHASPFGRPIYERMGFQPTNEMDIIRPQA